MKTKKFIKVDLTNKNHCLQLLNLLNQYMEDEMGLGKPMPKKLGPQIIRGLKNHSAYLGFFVCIDDEFAALANCNLNFSTWQAKPFINIHDFIVSPKFRNQRVGYFLLNEMAKYAEKNNYCRLNLEVRHDNFKAQSLYKKAGFDECKPPNYFWEKPL